MWAIFFYINMEKHKESNISQVHKEETSHRGQYCSTALIEEHPTWGRMIQNLESGGLNMINIKAFCHSLSASWIIRILEGNPDEDNFVQLPKFLS